MSAFKPKTLLSFVYNTTCVAAYRDEMHEDLRTAFARFQIDDGDAREACFLVEQAAYEIRLYSNDRFGRRATNAKHASAVQDLKTASQRRFTLVGDDIAEMALQKADYDATQSLARDINVLAPVAGPATGEGSIAIGPDGRITIQPTNTLGEVQNLLDLAYYFFHYRTTRAAILESPVLDVALSAIAAFKGDAAFAARLKSAISSLGTTMNSQGSPDAGTVRQDAALVGDALALEYQLQDACFCW